MAISRARKPSPETAEKDRDHNHVIAILATPEKN